MPYSLCNVDMHFTYAPHVWHFLQTLHLFSQTGVMEITENHLRESIGCSFLSCFGLLGIGSGEYCLCISIASHIL